MLVQRIATQYVCVCCCLEWLTICMSAWSGWPCVCVCWMVDQVYLWHMCVKWLTLYMCVEWLTVCMCVCGMVSRVYVCGMVYRVYMCVEWLTVCMCVECLTVQMCVWNAWRMIVLETFPAVIGTGGPHRCKCPTHRKRELNPQRTGIQFFLKSSSCGNRYIMTSLLILIEICRKFWECPLEFRNWEMNLWVRDTFIYSTILLWVEAY